MTRDDRIRAVLTERFGADSVEVVNESHLHAGHRSSPGTGESHYRVIVTSAQFNGLSRVARHRAINDLLANELAGGLHALAIETREPATE